MSTGPESGGHLEASYGILSALHVAYQRLRALNRQIAAEMGGALVPQQRAGELASRPRDEEEERLPLQGMRRYDYPEATLIRDAQDIADQWNSNQFEPGELDPGEFDLPRLQRMAIVAQDHLRQGNDKLWQQMRQLQIALVNRHRDFGDYNALMMAQFIHNAQNAHWCAARAYEQDALSGHASQPALGMQQPMLTTEQAPASTPPPPPESCHAKPVHIPRKRWSGGRKKFKYSSRLSF